jgi:hypothetical protein
MAASTSSHGAVRAFGRSRRLLVLRRSVQVSAALRCAALWVATEEAGEAQAAAGQALHMQCTGTLYA